MMDQRFAVVEPDVFFPFLPDHLSIFEKAPLCVRLSALCIETLHREGYHVIVAYPITDTDYVKFRELLSAIPADELTYITLAPDKETLLMRLGLHEDTSDNARWRRSIIEEQYGGVWWGTGVVNPSYESFRIDTAALTPKEVAEAVYARIEEVLAQK